MGIGLQLLSFFTSIASSIGIDKITVAIATFLNVNLYIFCDLIDSRGSASKELWRIYYLGPVNTHYEIV